MNFKRLIAILMVLVLSLGLFTGCKPTVSDEEEAVTDLIVEGEEQEQSGDAPEKVEPGDTDNEQGNETPDNTTPDGSQAEDKKEDNTPSEENKEPEKEDNTPSTDNEATTPEDNDATDSEDKESEDNKDDTPKIDPKDLDERNFLKIVAYNVRCANDGVHKKNGYSNDIADRAPRFKMMVLEVTPDIMALCEANAEWIRYLRDNIAGPRYKMIYKFRGENSREAQPILYDHTKFDLLDSGYFWLSETPEKESMHFAGEYIRGVTWVKLKIKATGKEFLYYSTHLSTGDWPMMESCDLIVKHATERGGFDKLPVFVSGDFNNRPQDAGYKYFLDYFNDFNEYLGFDDSSTTGGYVEKSGDGKIIDYIMGSPNLVVPTKYEVMHRFYIDGYISDHKGIYGECYIV